MDKPKERKPNPPVRVKTGGGHREDVRFALGSELLNALRERYPGLSDQDVVRAALWSDIGQPQVRPARKKL